MRSSDLNREPTYERGGVENHIDYTNSPTGLRYTEATGKWHRLHELNGQSVWLEVQSGEVISSEELRMTLAWQDKQREGVFQPVPINQRMGIIASGSYEQSAELNLDQRAAQIQRYLDSLADAKDALGEVEVNLQAKQQEALDQLAEIELQKDQASKHQRLQALSAHINGDFSIDNLGSPMMGGVQIIGKPFGSDQEESWVPEDYVDTYDEAISDSASMEGVSTRPNWLRRKTKKQKVLGGFALVSLAAGGISLPMYGGEFVHVINKSILHENPDAHLTSSDIEAGGVFDCLKPDGTSAGLYKNTVSAGVPRIINAANTDGTTVTLQIGSAKTGTGIQEKDFPIDVAACATPDAINAALDINDVAKTITIKLDSVTVQDLIKLNPNELPKVDNPTITEQLKNGKVILTKEAAAAATAALNNQNNYDLAVSLAQAKTLDVVNQNNAAQIKATVRDQLTTALNKTIAHLFDKDKSRAPAYKINFTGELKGPTQVSPTLIEQKTISVATPTIFSLDLDPQ